MKSTKPSQPNAADGSPKRSHPTTQKAKAAKKTSIAAPQPVLPGACGTIGIDIAKKTFHACYLSTRDAREQRGEFTNDAAGHAKFMLWVNRVSQGMAVHFCLEETGIYGRALAVFLHQAQHHVSLVNAALVKHHGRSLNLRSKTDRIDAWLIAHYTHVHVPPRWTPPAAQHQRLRELSRRRAQLTQMIVAESNHLEAAQESSVRSHIEAMIQHLQKQRESLWQQMQQLVKEDPALNKQRELLMSIPHIGEMTAMALLAELPPVDAFENARQICAYAGLTPRQEQSGESVHKRTRLCKQGRSGLRTLMFMPAVSVLSSKRGPLLGFAKRLQEAGKAKLCVVGALMRKLLAMAFAILRSGQPFDPHYRHSRQPQPATANL
jgi:transposase